MTLKDLEIGSSAIISSVGGEGALRQHFLDMGVIPGAEVMLVKYAPMGVDGFVLGTTLLFGQGRSYDEILKDIRALNL